jgi:hypothetical protein
LLFGLDGNDTYNDDYRQQPQCAIEHESIIQEQVDELEHYVLSLPASSRTRLAMKWV